MTKNRNVALDYNCQKEFAKKNAQTYITQEKNK